MNMLNPSSDYRLGDLVNGYIGKHHKLYPDFHPNPNIYCKKWSGSIGCEYISKTNKNNDYKTLKKIVLKRNENKTFLSNDSMTVHLRLGDVLTFKYYLNKNCINECRWVRPLDFYRKLKIPKSVNFIYIVCNESFRLKMKTHNNIVYKNEVIKILKNKNKTIFEYKGKYADDDFLFLTRSKYFVKSGGGFSKLAAIIGKELYNNTIY